ncbi:MAG: hypothetical protein ABSF91_03070 [Bacteroidota bacterium]|jgi:hypothetical protein
MKYFLVTYKEKGNRPSSSGILPSEWVYAIAEEDVPGELIKKFAQNKRFGLKPDFSEEEFKSLYKIEEIVEIKNEGKK